MPVRAGAFPALFLITAACSAALPTAPVRADHGALDWPVQAVSSATRTGYGAGHVTIGIMDTVSMSVDAVGLREGLELLSRPLEQSFRITWQDVVTAGAAVSLQKKKPDFLVLPTGQIEFLTTSGLGVYRIATRKPRVAVNAAEAVGSLFVTRADRDDIRSIADLKGRHIAADLETSLPGYLAALGEVAAQGYDPDRFFGRVSFLNTGYPNVISSLLSGKTDAAVLPTCLLEVLETRGLIASWQLKPLDVKDDGRLACRHSTALYPDISVVAFEWTPENVVRRMTVSLLSSPSGDGYEWFTTVRTSHLQELFRTLGVGPYRHLKDMTPAALYARWKTQIHGALLIFLFLILNEVRLRRLVKRRTAELSRALADLRTAEREARTVRERLGSLERKNIVAQMSGMIAHEIRSPVGAIRNFAAVVRILLKGPLSENENARTALEGIDSEALRISGIVDRVRGYVKNRAVRHVPLNLADAVRNGIRAFRLSSAGSIPLKADIDADPAPVSGDALELELLVLNLIKNAAEAVSDMKDRQGRAIGRVGVRLIAENEGNKRKYVLTVSDNGPALSPEEAKRLTESMESVKPEGLGLGLSIVRGIADSHGASVAFNADTAGGVTVRAVFEHWDEEHIGPDAAEETT